MTSPSSASAIEQFQQMIDAIETYSINYVLPTQPETFHYPMEIFRTSLNKLRPLHYFVLDRKDTELGKRYTVEDYAWINACCKTEEIFFDRTFTRMRICLNKIRRMIRGKRSIVNIAVQLCAYRRDFMSLNKDMYTCFVFRHERETMNNTRINAFNQHIRTVIALIDKAMAKPDCPDKLFLETIRTCLLDSSFSASRHEST